MGGCDFSVAGMGNLPMEVYTKLCQEAVAENGNQQGYNGTISTSDGFSMVELPPRRNVQKFIEGRLEKIDKRDCECIILPKAATSRWKETHGLKGKRGKVFVFFGIASC